MESSEGGQPQQSFAERKAAQLGQERAGREAQASTQPDPEPQQRPPEQALESEDLSGYPEEESQLPEAEASGHDGYDPDEDYDDLEEEAPSVAPDDTPEQPAENWEKRFKDTERKLSEVTENRRAIEQEHADMMSANLTLKHGLEDQFTEAKRYVEAYKGGFDQQIAQLENAFNSGMIPPDDLPGARQQYQALVNQRNGLAQQIEQINSQQGEAKKLENERKAEIARVRLARTIPGWSRETYDKLGSYAMERGYTAEEFSENVDYRFYELLNDSMQLRQAGDTVKNVKRQRKANGPRRNAKQQPRSADGRYRQAKQEFRDNPNQRGRFADMKLAELRKDRRR